MIWTVHHRSETASTNADARAAGRPGDVFTADYQTAGRGRLDHRWLSPPGSNLMMSAVLPADGLPPETVATLPLVVGLAVVRAVGRFAVGDERPLLKWPNDVLVGGRKICGILCERAGDTVIAGIGVNVAQDAFPPEIAERATSFRLLSNADTVPTVGEVRDSVLAELGDLCVRWRDGGFAAVYRLVSSVDFLRGKFVSVCQTDADDVPVAGLCGGIRPDGSLDVAGKGIYAGEAHVECSSVGAIRGKLPLGLVMR